MNKLLNLKLKHKVLFSFVIILSMLALLGLRFYFTIIKLEKNKNEILQSVELASSVSEIKFTMAHDLKLIMEIITANNQESVEEFWGQHQIIIKEFDDAMVRLYTVASDKSWGEDHDDYKNDFLNTAGKIQEFREKQLVPYLEEIHQMRLAQLSGQQISDSTKSAIDAMDTDLDKNAEPILKYMSVNERKAKEFLVIIEKESAELSAVSKLETVILIIAGVLLSLLLAFILSTYLTNIISKLNNSVKLLSEGKLSTPIVHNSSDELGEMVVAFNHLTVGLQTTTDFANEIGSGNFDMEFKALSNDDVLGNALIGMRANLLKVAEEESKRNWATEGMAVFGEILRDNTAGIDVLANNIIIKLSKYIGANQAALFIVNDTNPNDRYLEMLACYAWDRQKHLEKKILPGDGVIGQAWQENELVYITEIPEDYIEITSGLGEANPNNILLVPLTVNDVTYGMIEIASFNHIEEYQMEFMTKLAESIASTLSAVKTNERTKRLLEQSQLQTEQMRAQEEEMRQNMEEMQATQEEMERKEQVMQGMVEKMQIQEEELRQNLAELKASTEKTERANAQMTKLNSEIENRDKVFGLTTILSESDIYGNVTYANQKLVEVSKYSMDEIIGKPHNMFRHPDMPAEIFKLMWDTIKEGNVFKGIVKNKAKDGTPYWVDATIMPVKNDMGYIVKYIGARYHIKDEKYAEAKYQEQLKKLGLS